MKRVLDRLMARQMKLMGDLAADPRAPTRPKAEPPQRVLGNSERADALAQEQRATDAAFVHLQDGRLDEALTELLPHAAHAQSTRTLTTIARIHAAQGRFDDALAQYRRAERLDPADNKVLHFAADLLRLMGRHVEELQYRRRAAFTTAQAPGTAFVALIAAIVKAAPAGRPPPVSEIRLALDRIRRADDVPPDKLLDAARTLYGVKALAGEAKSLYASTSPCAPHEHDITATWCTMVQWCDRRGARLHSVPDVGAPGRRAVLAEVQDALVHPGLQWVPLLDNCTTILTRLASRAIGSRAYNPASPLLMASAETAVLRLPRDVPVVDAPAILIGGDGTYDHDLIEYIGSLAIVERLGIGQDARLIVNDNLVPHQLELLELLGIAPERLLRVPANVPTRFRRLLVPSRASANGRWFGGLLPAWYRERLAAHLSTAPASRRLYLSRGAAASRRLDNESDVVAALTPLGFETVTMDAMTLAQRIALFSQASHLVAPTGAELASMLFSPPGARIVVLDNQHSAGNGNELQIEALANACGHAVETVSCRAARLAADQRVIDADLAVDIEALKAALSRLGI